MTTDQLYRERAKSAREKAEATADPEDRLLWWEVSMAFEHFAEHFADLPEKV